VITTNRQFLTSYITTNTTILTTLFASLSTSLRLPADTFASRHTLAAPSGCHIRFISAPPQEASTRSNSLGEHTDFGSLTILLNRLGGLQVQLPGTEEWVYVQPMPGCAIVNLGDAMVRFSGGILRSNLHRVVSPPGEQAQEVRRSLVYFSRPEHNVVLTRLRGGLVDELGDGAVEEEGVSAREWLVRRHIGRKIEYFEGKESWEGSMGTEARPLVSTH
jgi:isopenicillin N synthase-like dioxygenase